MQNFLQNHEWARNSNFDHFWSHYAITEQWRNQHSDAFHRVYSGAAPGDSDVLEDVQVTERLSKCEIREEIEETEEVEEMSEEMRDFFAKTQEHRRKLAEKRAAEENEKPWSPGNQEEYVDVEKITVRGRIQPTAEHRNANAELTEKRETARKMYGSEAASRILAMESQMEMRFEEEYSKNPQLWPNIPFRF